MHLIKHLFLENTFTNKFIITVLFIVSFGYFVYQVWRYQVSELSKTRVKVSRILKKYREIIVELEYKPSFEI